MSDFDSSFWSYYITIITLGGVIFCVWLLFTQRAWLGKTIPNVEDTGHVWDQDLTELNYPVPRWWTIFYLILCAIALSLFFLYPGLGSYKGYLDFSAAEQVKQEQEALRARIEPVYQKYREMPFEQIARDPQAIDIGQRLFLNYCAQCHGSDAKGAGSFPNLTDGDWIHGGNFEQIQYTIEHGRKNVMPAWADQISPAQASDLAQYVRSLSGLAYDPLRIVAGKRLFENYCVACHGVDGKGNQAIGAPNLTDGVWLFGSSEASIVSTILNGRQNIMPPQSTVLTPDQIRVLTAWVWGLSHPADAAAKK